MEIDLKIKELEICNKTIRAVCVRMANTNTKKKSKCQNKLNNVLDKQTLKKKLSFSPFFPIANTISVTMFINLVLDDNALSLFPRFCIWQTHKSDICIIFTQCLSPIVRPRSELVLVNKNNDKIELKRRKREEKINRKRIVHNFEIKCVCTEFICFTCTMHKPIW